MKRISILAVSALAATMLVAGCQTAPAPAPTQAPAKPAATTAPAAPAPTKAAAPTTAPAAAPTAVPAKKVDFPQAGKPITIVVPTSPGGSLDLNSRALAPVLEKILKVPVQILNKAGGATLIGSGDVAKAKPDGYTMGYFTISTLTMGLIDPEKKTELTRKSWAPVAMVTNAPNLVVALANSPYKDGKDLAEAAKAKPDTITMGAPGLYSPPHLAGFGVQQTSGAKFRYVLWDGAGDVMTNLLGGHVDVAGVVEGGSTSEQARAGKIRILGITGPKRSAFHPDVKTWQELGGWKVENSMPTGFAVAAGTPKEIVDILSSAVKTAMDSQEIKDLFKKNTVEPKYADAASMDTFWANFEANAKGLMDLAKKAQQ